MNLLIAGIALGLVSCAPKQYEELKHKEGAHAPKIDTRWFDDRTGAFQTHDDTNPARYKGRKTPVSLDRPGTRGSIAECNYRQYPKRKKVGNPGDYGP